MEDKDDLQQPYKDRMQPLDLQSSFYTLKMFPMEKLWGTFTKFWRAPVSLGSVWEWSQPAKRRYASPTENPASIWNAKEDDLW